MNQDMWRCIKDAVRAVLPVEDEEITVDRDFKALGADSIDRLEIIHSLRRELGIQQPTSAFVVLPNIGALAEFCEIHALRFPDPVGAS